MTPAAWADYAAVRRIERRNMQAVELADAPRNPLWRAEAKGALATPRERNVAPLYRARLAYLPPDVAQALQDLPFAPHEEALNAVIARMWHALQENTTHLESKWDLLKEDLNLRCLPKHERARAELVAMRYREIPPVRHSAVDDPVRSGSMSAPRYLNANVVELDCGIHFIAAQKPMLSEIAGFHRVLLDKNVGVIVDLTRGIEKEKQTIYAPRINQSMQAAGGGVTVTCERLPDQAFQLKRLRVEDDAGHCDVQRLHFKGWPDHGVVSQAHLIEIADRAEALNVTPDRPMVVHCMAGVGRTGTLISFIAARSMLQRAVAMAGGRCGPERMGKMLMAVVAHARLQRGPRFIETEQQFGLVMHALLETFSKTISSRSQHPRASVPRRQKSTQLKRGARRLAPVRESPDEDVDEAQPSAGVDARGSNRR